MNPQGPGTLADITYQLTTLAISLVILAFVFLGLLGLFYLVVLWRKEKQQHERSLDSVLLQVAVPRDNEVKIDVAEQMFASFYSIKSGGFFSFLSSPDHLSFEIVGRPQDIWWKSKFTGLIPEPISKK